MHNNTTQQENYLQESQGQDLPNYCPDFRCGSYQRDSLDASLSTTTSRTPLSRVPSETSSEPESPQEKRTQALKNRT